MPLALLNTLKHRMGIVICDRYCHDALPLNWFVYIE